ncbi:C-X-C motif chemokine 11-6-like [Chaetodon auriga]|uniref:C-X-C motif chemokine 11-6-like n=1 Tax=Chaetodon auriga TaxID=39042 RepID=UPI004032F05E
MKTAIQCIILLACAAICTAVIKNCQCLNTSRAVKPSLIADVREYRPRPYCNKHEVIVILKDKSSRCLNPNHRFTQAVLQTIQMQKAKQAAKMNTTAKPKTATVSVTAVPTTS